MNVTFFGRYAALGIERPDPATVCKGQCEGTGLIPVPSNCRDRVLRKLWHEAQRRHGPSEDGYHFVKCPTCKGSGKRKATASREDAKARRKAKP